MESQTDLFAQVIDEQAPKTPEEMFHEYHLDNPRIFELFEMFARQALNAGLEHYGAKAIMEQVRWKVCVSTQDDEGFKINNNYTSRYARLLVEKYPEFRDFFEMRELKSA